MTVDVNPNSVKKIQVEASSSLVETLDYDKSAMTLAVLYKAGKRKGSVRTYRDISLVQFLELLAAESVGKAVIKLAKGARKEYLN